MKIKYLLIIILIFSSKVSLSQDNKSVSIKNGDYIPLKTYWNLYKLHINLKDSTSYKIVNKDTLILIKNKSKLERLAKRNKKHSGDFSIFEKNLKVYMPLNQYRKRFPEEITEEDLSDIKIHNGDTLILIRNKEYYKKRVIVPYESKDSTFLEVYKDIVFQKYSKGKNYEKLRMRYWKDDIRIFFSKNMNKVVKKEITTFAKFLSKNVDSLNIKFVNKLEKSNYIIYGLNSDNDYNYEPKLKPGKVDFYVYWNGGQQIYKAKLQIDSRAYDNEDDLVLKSKIMFLMSLGYFSHTYKLPKESYFSLYYFVGKKFTETDLEILKYHYSYGICKGTNLHIFEEQHERATKLLKSHNQRINFVYQN